MKLIGNILWFLFTGLGTALAWFFLGLGWCITIVGIPFGLQAFKFAKLSLFPFGKVVTSHFVIVSSSELGAYEFTTEVRFTPQALFIKSYPQQRLLKFWRNISVRQTNGESSLPVHPSLMSTTSGSISTMHPAP